MKKKLKNIAAASRWIAISSTIMATATANIPDGTATMCNIQT